MSEQELRGKIVKILEEYRDWFVEEDYKRDIAKIDYTGIADALIEEGIGDISEYKHRAEVAEKAVREFVAQIDCRSCPFNGRCEVTNPNCDYEECYKSILYQAEKELQEETQE